MNKQEAITIRRMTESDLDAVVAIEKVSFPSPWLREHFLSEISAPHSFPFVAIIDESVAGYVCMISLFEETQILNIAVKSSHRGTGLAKMLLEHAMGEAIEQGADFAALEVRESNLAAISLYEGMGFARTGTRRNYYEGNEDAVLMEKTLQGAK